MLFTGREYFENLGPFQYGSNKQPDMLSLKEAREEFTEFLENVPRWVHTICERLNKDGVKLDQSHEQLMSDVGKWLMHGSRRSGRVLGGATVDECILSAPTMSACCFVGVLMVDFLMKDVPGSSWMLVEKGSRSYIHYHRPVWWAQGMKTHLHSPSIIMNFVRSNLRNPRSQSDLSDLYTLWRSIGLGD